MDGSDGSDPLEPLAARVLKKVLSECGGHAAALYSPAMPPAYTTDLAWAAGMAGEHKAVHGHRTSKENQPLFNTLRCVQG